jgi:hypothetical protein
MQDELIHSRPKLRKGLMIGGIAVLVLALVLSLFLAFLSPLSQRWVVKALSEHYHADVHLQSFQVSLWPHVVVSGGGLVLAHREQPNAPPVASIRHFSMATTWLGLLRHPAHVRDVDLEGLTINVSPKPQKETKLAIRAKRKKKRRLPPFYFERVTANGTVLNIFSSNPQKPPRVFAISRLQLRSVSVGKAMSFQATLTNPKPIGQIHTTGKFGPWNPDDPSLTPVSGLYAFQDADLSSIHGLAGILSSQGKFDGMLGLITVHGETDTPQFGLGISSNRVDLKTQFEAVVDGMNGDTLLRPVKAWLGESVILARGGVLRATGIKGKVISLTVTANHARLADLLALSVKSSTPPIVGAISLHTQFDLPPGNEDITRRLKLDGDFDVRTARFTDPEVEQKMTHLSQRSQGRPGQPAEKSAVLNLRGHFVLSNAVMSFSRLSFNVPGASVNLQGVYGLLSEDLNFRGNLRMKAKLSQTTTGIKSVLLKAIDPLFKGQGAGTVVPIKITGTRRHPAFGIQFGKIFRRRK